MNTNLTVPPIWRRLARDPLKPESRLTRWTVALCFLGLAGLAAPPLRAQEVPRVQVFGGYSYTSFDSKALGYSGFSGLNGGTLMAAGNINHGFGVLAQASVGFGSGINLRDAL